MWEVSSWIFRYNPDFVMKVRRRSCRLEFLNLLGYDLVSYRLSWNNLGIIGYWWLIASHLILGVLATFRKKVAGAD